MFGYKSKKFKLVSRNNILLKTVLFKITEIATLMK